MLKSYFGVMAMRCIIAGLCVLGMQKVAAVEISSVQAQKAVANWLLQGEKPLETKLLGSVRNVETVQGSGTNALFHIVTLKEGGLIVTSADDGIMPIIAFSEDNEIIKDLRNPFWTLLKKDMEVRLALVRNEEINRSNLIKTNLTNAVLQIPKQAYSSYDSAKERWKNLLSEGINGFSNGTKKVSYQSAGISTISSVRVSPLVKTKWGQDTVGGKNVYNYYTPNNYVCGCVATAAAQLLRKHQYPTTSISPQSFDCWVDSVGVRKTMLGGVYSWASMPEVPSSSITLAQQQAIGKLCYDIGVSSRMSWKSASQGGSGAHIHTAAEAFTNVFKYANSVAHYPFRNLTPDEIERALLCNFDAEFPVILSITDANGGNGHAIVADGYGYNSGVLYCHLNFGWSGNSDAWYNLPNIGTGYNYSIIDVVAYNIFPQKRGDLISGRILDSAGQVVSGATVTVSSDETDVSCTSNEKGIYSVILPGDKNYQVKAQYDNQWGSIEVYLPKSKWPSYAGYNDQGELELLVDSVVGNSWGNDIVIKDTPPNDDFADATLISGERGSIEVSNVGATFETGEPEHKYSSATTSVWWKWTPSKSGSVTFSTEGSSFDTILAVYTGNTLSSLEQYALDDDKGSNSTSICTFEAVAGTTYYIAIAGYNAKTGTIKLSWEQTIELLPNLMFPIREKWPQPVFLSNVTGEVVSVNSFDCGETVYLNVAFGNDGDMSTTNGFTIIMEVMNENGELIGSMFEYANEGLLATSTSVNPPYWGNFPWGSLNNLAPGSYTYRCTLDVYDEVKELDETDNIWEYEFIVETPPTVFTIKNGVLTGVELNGATEVVIPDGVTSIGRRVFYECASLKKVVIPDSVTSILSEAFSWCSSLQNVRIPNGVTYIGARAFSQCDSFTSVEIPDGVTEIENETFRGCNSLGEVTIGNGVTNIEDYAFYYCGSITNIHFGGKIERIGLSAFDHAMETSYGYEGDICVHISNLTNWCNIDFISETSNPLYEGAKLYVNNELVSDLAIPEEAKQIGDYAFCGCVSLTSVSIPDTINIIWGAFRDCCNLTYAWVPISLREQVENNYVFSNCSDDLQIEYYSSSHIIAFNANGGVVSQEGMTVEYGERIGALPNPTRDGYTFLGWFTAAEGGEQVSADTVVTGDMTLYAHWEEVLKEPSFEIDENGVLSSVELNGAAEIIIPSNVKVIADETLSGCCDLTSVTIPEGVVSIGYDAFNCCCALTSINIPSTVTNIGDNAFGNCTNLRIVTGGEGLKRVGYDAFYETLFLYGEDSWEDIEVNEDYANGYGLDLVQLGNFIVGRRGSLAEAENDEYYDEEGNWIWEYNLIISEGITGIADSLFEGLPITSVTIPGSVSRISFGAFSGCSYLNQLTLGEGIEEIEYGAFCGCSYESYGIERVVFPSSVKKIGEEAFSNCYRLKYVSGIDDTDDIHSGAFYGTPYVDGWQAPVLDIEDGVVYGLGWATRFDDGCITNNVLYIPEGVTNVADCAFNGSCEFSKVVLPSSLRSIGYEAFYDCKELREVEGGNNLECVGYDAFNKTLFLYKADSWEDVESNGDYLNDYGLELVCLGNFIVGRRGELQEAWNDEYFDENENWIWEYNLVIPEGVTGIADSLFEDLPITSVTIPGSIKRIPENAFNSCCYLKNLTINEGVEEIGDYAFQRAGSYLEEDGITTLTIPSSVTKIGEYGFASLGCLKYVVGLDDADDVHSDAFYGTPYADGWEAPVLIIEDGVVYGLDRETRFDDGCITNNVLYIPEGVTNIADCAFKEMYEFSKAVLPSSLRSIGHEAFYDCEELREVEGGVNLERVGYNVFNETLFLYKADSWEDVESNGDYLNDYGLDLVCLGNFIVGRRGSLAEAEKDEYYDDEGNWIWKYELVIPEGVTGLADELFNNLPITSVTIPNSIVSIPDYTFTYTELESVVIPENIVSIGEEAFASCANLKYAKVPLALKSQVEEGNVFAYCSPDLQIEYYDNASLVAPVITPGDGTEFYEDSCTVTITCETEGSTIYYTTDGTTPRPRPANLYTEPFEIADTTTVKAIAVKGEERTDLVSATIVKKEIVLAAPVITPTDGTEFYEDSCMVTISCATEGASIYYIVCDTNNVTNPRPSDRNLYTGPFTVSATKMVRAFSMFGSKTSDIVSSTLIKCELTLPVAVDAPELTFTTGGDAKWTPEFNGSANVGGSLAQSGALSWSETDDDPSETWMETTVAGAGTFSFWWKVDCEDDPWGATWDRFEVYTNGVEAARIDGKTEWEKIEFTFADSRTHTVRWRFCKDDWDDEKLTDLAWVDGVDWTPASTDVTVDVGGGKNVVVPVSWIDKYDNIVTAAGGDKVAALMLTAANGRKVWECFMLGIDPTKADDDFKITRFWMENGKPMFEFSHSVDGAGNSFAPRIKTKGKAKLSDSWSDVPTGGDSSFRFFTVEVMLP